MKGEDALLTIVISLLVGAGASYAVTSLSPTPQYPPDIIEQLDQFEANIASVETTLSTEIDSLRSTLESLNTQVLDMSQIIADLSSDIYQLRSELEKEKAFLIFKQYMIDSGSNLATVISSQIVDELDNQGKIPSIFGYGKEQIKNALRTAITTLLSKVIPSSSWTELDAVSPAVGLYLTSLNTAFPISVNVFGVDLNIARVKIVATSLVDIVSKSVTDLKVTDISLIF